MAAVTNTELRDQAVGYLEKVTGRYNPNGKNWKQALALLAQITDAPPPPPSGSVLFDGRATNFATFSTSGAPPNFTQTQTLSDPAVGDLWTALAFKPGLISLVPDTHYGTVYKNTVTTGDQTPWGGSDVIDGAAETSWRRDNMLGKWLWFAQGARIDGWQGSPADVRFCEVLSIGYQTSASSQVALGPVDPQGTGKLQWGIYQNAGYGNNPTGWAQGSVAYTQTFEPVTFGQRVEFVVGVKVSTGDDGEVQVYSRPAGGTWAQVFDHHGATEFYGVASGNTFTQDGSDWPTVLDKIGLYFGTHDNAVVTQTVYETGLVVCTDLATAQASFPA